MAKNWAICIGINQYQYIKPLTCAVNDADGMYQWFQDSQKFENIYRFTDNSPPITDINPELPSKPTYTTLRRWIRKRFNPTLKKVLSPSDNLWFFFSGHGWRHQGEDYLLLCDSDPDPEEIDNSAIKISWIVDYLRNSGAGNIMLLIDACRDSAKNGMGLDLSQQQGVISLASCSPNEKSYEIPELKQGSFTYALIESLTIQGENNCATVERLCKRVKHRVRELNQQYKQPKQTPIATIEPETKNHLILLPDYIRPTLGDIQQLKIQALYAEKQNDLKLAEILWTRLVIHDTEEALANLREIWLKLASQANEVIHKPETSERETAIAQAKLEVYQEMVEKLQPKPNSNYYFPNAQFGGGFAGTDYTGNVENVVNQPQSMPNDTLIHGRGANLAPDSNSVNNDENKSVNKVVLESEKNIDYQPLKSLLSQGKWREADEKTSELMLEAMGKSDWWDVSSDDLLSFPKKDLRTMDQLWLKYSEGKFGFSVQKQIWLDCGGKVGVYDYDVYCKFADQVGWRKGGNWLSYNQLYFTINSLQGHLPGVGAELGCYGMGGGFSFLCSRL